MRSADSAFLGELRSIVLWHGIPSVPGSHRKNSVAVAEAVTGAAVTGAAVTGAAVGVRCRQVA